MTHAFEERSGNQIPGLFLLKNSLRRKRKSFPADTVKHKSKPTEAPQACFYVLQQFCHIQGQMDDSVFDHDILGIKNIRVANDR